MTFRLWGMEVSFSFWFFAVVLCFALVGRMSLMLYFVLPMVVHELGHLVAMGICGVGIRSVSFTALGVDIHRKGGAGLSYGREFFICLAGVAANCLFALGLYVFCFQSMRVMFLVAANIAIVIFNLLPIGDLDGGQLTRLVAARVAGPDIAAGVSRGASLAALTVLFAFGIFLLLQGELNPTLLIAVGYLAGLVILRE